jgi:hypothetical protein
MPPSDFAIAVAVKLPLSPPLSVRLLEVGLNFISAQLGGVCQPASRVR